MSENESCLILKWGIVKGWNNIGDKAAEILNLYFVDGIPLGCANDKPNEQRRKILCNLIDIFDGTITNDWTGKKMTKNAAKKYVMEYK